METSIAIIGMGFLSPAGKGQEAFYQQINAGILSGNLEDYDPGQYLGDKGLRFVGDSTKLYCHLAFQCIENAGLTEEIQQNPDRFGLYDGSELSILDEVFDYDLTAKVKGPDNISPMKAPNVLANASASFMAIKAGVGGPNFSVCGGATGSLQALDIAFLHLLEDLVGYGIVTSTEGECALHNLVHLGEGRQNNYRPASPFGVSFAVATTETAAAEHHQVWANILQVRSGHRLGYEDNHEVLLRLIDEMLANDVCGKEIDGIILGGVHNMDIGRLMEDLWWDFDIEHAKVHLPERLFGACDNNAGALGLLYAKGLSENRITRTSVRDLKKCFVGVVDRLGYASVALASFD